MAVSAPTTLRQLGQSLWLDNITRDLLESGTLQRYIDTLSITGLTSNPTIFDHAISRSTSYDAEIHRQLDAGVSGATVSQSKRPGAPRKPPMRPSRERMQQL